MWVESAYVWNIMPKIYTHVANQERMWLGLTFSRRESKAISFGHSDGYLKLKMG